MFVFDCALSYGPVAYLKTDVRIFHDLSINIYQKPSGLLGSVNGYNPPSECTQIGTVGIDVIDFRGLPLWLKILKHVSVKFLALIKSLSPVTISKRRKFSLILFGSFSAFLNSSLRPEREPGLKAPVQEK
jgi:hypothetical protein